VTGVPEIELRGIAFALGGRELLHDVNLSLAKGETLFAMGGAGSGKSLLLKTAAGITPPSEGEVFYRGKPFARMSAREELAFRKVSGFVFQDAALWSNQRLFDNLALPVRLHEPLWGKAEVERAVKRVAELVGYEHELHARPAEISSGGRKLIGLARALVLDPELLFMDDPTSILDEASAARVLDIVDALKGLGCSVIVASAASEFASRCADSIAVLLGGSLAARGQYAEAAAWTDPRVRAVTGRLKARESAKPVWADGLVGAWVSALAEDEANATGHSAPSGSGDSADAFVLGDQINDVPDEDARDDDERKGGL
jgi:phospholipid/cholesterol/gamma-HCH transport system ATP-binding protein